MLIIPTVLSGLGFVFTLILIKRLTTLTRLVGLLFLLSLLSDLFAYFLYFQFKVNPNYIVSLYLILSIPVYGLIYYQAYERRYKNFILAATGGFLTFAVVNLLLIQRMTINSYSNILLAVIVLTYALFYFYTLIKELPATHLLKLPMFWVNSAFIVYFSGNLSLFAFTTYLVNVLKNNLAFFWTTFHNLLGVIESVILIIAVWVDWKNEK